MKYLLLLLTTALCAAPQSLGPYGTFLSETFDAGGPCGYGYLGGTIWNTGLYAYNNCNLIWGSATLHSGTITVGASRGSKAHPIGPQSLLLTTDSGSGNTTYIQTAGFHPTVSSGTTFDVYLHLNVNALTLAAFSASHILTLSQLQNGTSAVAALEFNAGSANAKQLLCIGATGTSRSAPLTADTDYFVKMHIVSGETSPGTSSTCSIASGTQWLGVDPQNIPYTQWGTFRAGAANWLYTAIGTLGDATASASTYSVGYLLADVPLRGQGNGPSYLFSPSVYGSAASNIGPGTTQLSVFNGATVGGNGTWNTDQTGSSCTTTHATTDCPHSFTSGAHLPLSSPVDVLGSYYGGSEGTPLGHRYDMSLGPGTGLGYLYTFTSFSPVLSFGYKLQTSLSSSDTSTNDSANWGGKALSAVASTNIIANSGAGTNQVICLETSNTAENGCTNGSDVGSWFLYTPNTTYFVQVLVPQYHACVAGMECIAPGSITTGTFSSGENVTSSSGATGTLIGTVTGSMPTRALHLTLTSGTPGGTDTWTGQRSGAVYTATAVPQNFATMRIYDNNCALLSTQSSINTSNTPGVPVALKIGRSGDTGNPSKTVFTDYEVVDYSRAHPIPCR